MIPSLTRFSALASNFETRRIPRGERLKRQRIRVGTMDLRIAAIALANGMTVLTRNRADFGRVPNLNVEDWTI